jgi:oligopeptide/dipeptide ABC transporter ATP-binding protein
MSDIVSARGISKQFATRRPLTARVIARLAGRSEPGAVRALDGVDITIRRGEALGLVGESGSGKSTLGRIIAGLIAPSEGSALLDGAPVRSGGGRGLKLTTRIQVVFQDPFASLDPRMRIGDTIAEGPLVHGLVSRAEADDYVAHWLRTVGLDAAAARRFPHQFSGGQRQRIAIARALAMRPDVLVCDEPVASLDVSIQAQIINLFLRLRRELDLTMLFISHDLGVVRHLCDRVAVLYLGRIIETGPTPEVFAAPAHPYTRALLDAVPKLGAGRATFRPIVGEIPSPIAPPSGCHFHPRCPIAIARCRTERPAPQVNGARMAACHLAGTMP